MAKEKLINLYSELVLPKIFKDPSVPTQKVRECIASPGLTKEGDVPINLKDVLKNGNRKTLFLGDQGTGKSTLIAKLMNLWADGELPQFELAFELNLKSLLSAKWNSNSPDVDDNPLAYFIYSTLRQAIPDRENRITFEDIKVILGDPSLKGKILFAVDGLDAISHLLNKDHIAKDIIGEIFVRESSAGDFVVSTARPNVLSDNMEKSFPYKVEVTGLDPEGVILYVQNYYSSQAKNLLKLSADYFSEEKVNDSGSQLISYLGVSTELSASEAKQQLWRVESFVGSGSVDEQGNAYSLDNVLGVTNAISAYYKKMTIDLLEWLKNPSIARMAESPMMLMIILVLSEAQGSGKLNPNSTPDEVFQKIAIQMAKIYLSQENGEEIKNIGDERALSLDAIKILKEIAYQLYLHDGRLTGYEIEDIIGDIVSDSNYGIVKFYEFGALRVVGSQDASFNNIEANDLLNQDHAIIHISFQTYLAACALIERLTSDNEEIYKEASYFIAHNRNNSQYLMLFKFVAGMLTKDPASNQKAITIFWNAIECNLDLVFEIGDRKKVILLMNLVQQSKKDGVIDPRIPNLEAVIKFIDDVVIQDFNFWKYEISKSGYWSKKMQVHFWNVIEKVQALERSNSEGNLQSLGAMKPIHRTLSFSSVSTLGEDEKQEKFMLEMAGTLLNNIDVQRLFKTLLRNIEGERFWEIKETSMIVITKIITEKKHAISSSEMSNILSKTKEFINDEELKGCAINALKILVEVHKGDNSIIKLILNSLLEVFKAEKDNYEIKKLIHNIIINHDDSMIDVYLDAFIPIIQGQENSHVASPFAKLSISRSMSYDDNPMKIFDLALNMLIDIIKSGNIKMANMALNRLANILREKGDTSGNVSKAIGEILAVSGLEVQRVMFERIISNIQKDTLANVLTTGASVLTTGKLSVNTGVVTAINSVLNTGVTIKTEFASQILSALSLLLNIELNKDDLIEAISKIASIATENNAKMSEVDIEVGERLLTGLQQQVEEHPAAYIAMAKVAKNGKEIVIAQAIGTFFAAIDKNEVALILEPLNVITSGEIPVSLVKVMLDKLMPLMEGGANDLVIALANLLANAGDRFSDERSDFIDRLITILRDSVDFELHKNIADAIYIICKNNNTLNPPIIYKLIELLRSVRIADRNDINKEIKTNVVSLLSKITASIDEKLAQNLFALYRTMLEANTCDGQILKDAIGEVAALNQGVANSIIDSLLELDSENPIVISTVIHALGEISTKQELDTEKANLLIKKLINVLDKPELKSSILYIVNKILKNSASQHDLIGEVPLLLKFITEEKSVAKYAIGIIARIAEKEPVEDEALDEVLSQMRILLDSNHGNKEIIESIPKIIGAMRLNNVVQLLKDVNSDIRDNAATQLIQKLKNEDLSKEWKGGIIKILNELLKVSPSESWTAIIEQMIVIINSDKIIGVDANTAKKEKYDKAVEKIKYAVKQMGPKEDILNFLDDSFGRIDENSAIELMKIVFSAVYGSEHAIEGDASFSGYCVEKFGLFPNEFWAENLEDMITIIGDRSVTDDKNLKELYEYSAQRIKLLITTMDEDEVNLTYITENFNRLVSKAGKFASQMMEQVIHSLLKDGVITENERKYIEICIIQFNLTLSISTREKDGHVTFVIGFGNEIYYLKGEENRVNIEHIANIVLESDRGILAGQYRDNKAIFPNSGEAIPRAAVDIEDCKDLLTDNQLEMNKWKAYWIYESNDQKWYPESASIILFTREIGGYFVGYKITMSSENHITMTTYRVHPENMDNAFREDIFGEMSHDEDEVIKARIFSLELDVSYEQGLSMINAAREAMIESGQETAVNRRELYASGDAASRQSVFQLNNWGKNIHQAYNRATGNMEKQERKKLVKELYKFTHKFIPELSQFVTASWTKDCKIVVEHGREAVGDNEHRQSRDFDAEQYGKQAKIDTDAANEVREISKHPIKKGCYDELMRGINAIYAAAEVIRSGWVEGGKKGDAAVVGNAVLSTAGSLLAPVIPGAGMVTEFLKKILNGLDQEHQKEVIERIYRFARDGTKMNIIAENIARKLSLNLDSIDVNAMDNVIKGFLRNLMDVMDGGVEGLVVDALVAVKGAMEEKDASTISQEKGEELAVIIAKYIVKQISDGEYKHNKFLNRAEYTAKIVIRDVTTSYPKTVITHSSSTALGVEDINYEDEDPNESSGSQVRKAVPVVGGGGCHGGPSHCIIARAEVERTDWDRRLSAIASLSSKEERRDALKKFGDPQDTQNESELLKTEFGMKLLYQAKSLYGEEGYSRILSLYENKETSELILAGSETLNFDQMLDMLLIGVTKVDINSENIFLQTVAGINLLYNAKVIYGKEACDQLLNLGMDREVAEQILAKVEGSDAETILDVFFGQTSEVSIENFRMIVEDEDSLADRNGFDQYINAAKYDSNGFANHAKNVIKNINHYYKMLEEAYKGGEITNKVAIVSTLLEFLLDHAASGQGKIVGGFRPPYDPGDDFGPGGSGGSGQFYENNNGNQSDHQPVYNLILSDGISLNITGIAKNIENSE